MIEYSPLQKARLKAKLTTPKVLKSLTQLIWKEGGTATSQNPYNQELARLFPLQQGKSILKLEEGEGKAPYKPLKVGVVFSGGPASGGHNVIAGLYETLKKTHPQSELLGFLGGPSGLIKNQWITIDSNKVEAYFNQGGFDMLGTGRTKVETEAQFGAVGDMVKKNGLQGLVVVGGDDSNTNAVFLTEYFQSHEIDCSVIGIPKTIDGDLKNAEIEVSFGFDSACKTYSETIGNILKDAASQKKYTFFIKIMGRSASHVALECALQTHPNLTWIGEEVFEKKLKLNDLVKEASDLIIERSSQGKNYSVILIPEGLIEFIPEFKEMIRDLNRILATDKKTYDLEQIKEKLSHESLDCLNQLPKEIQEQLLLERDPHGNIQVSKIETDRLIMLLVKQTLSQDISFSAQSLFLGYDGRSCLPSNFDCNYAYTLGQSAALLLQSGATGYMACVKRLQLPAENWEIFGIPLLSMMTLIEKGKGLKPVIGKGLVDLGGAPFKNFSSKRAAWAKEDHYLCPGPIQFFGEADLVNSITLTLKLEEKVKI